MKILGISAYYHDSGAAIIDNGKVLAAVQEERFTRKKHDSRFPAEGIKYCLQYAGCELSELDAIVFYDKPFLKFERLLETYYNFAPRGLRAYLMAMPVWLKEKIFLKKIIRDELKKVSEDSDFKKLSILFPEHHLSHAASAYYPSPFDDAAILTLDGVGEWATASICHGTGKDIKIIKELHFPHSIGLLYSAFTYYLGFRVNSGEYKLMGMAPYGNPQSENTKRYIEKIKEHLIDIKSDGSVGLNQDYFDYAAGLKMANDVKWEKLFGFPKRGGETEINQDHCNLGYAIQQVTEEIVLIMARHAKELTGAKNLCLAGGVALNCVANGKIVEAKIYDQVWIQPAAGDAGGALGAAYAAYHITYGKERDKSNGRDKMCGSYLGPEYSDLDVEQMSRKHNAKFEYFEDFEKLCEKVANMLDNGKVVGWHQGRMEWGPRALGNRTILGDPRSPDMQKKLNLRIKFRESFRPFAPSVLAEDQNEYFDFDAESPYMLFVGPVRMERRKSVPKDYDQFDMRNKLYFERSDLPAITHIDFSARIQSVHKSTNFRYWSLIT